jgi:hypothetical protein
MINNHNSKIPSVLRIIGSSGGVIDDVNDAGVDDVCMTLLSWNCGFGGMGGRAGLALG